MPKTPTIFYFARCTHGSQVLDGPVARTRDGAKRAMRKLIHDLRHGELAYLRPDPSTMKVHKYNTPLNL